MTNLPLMRMTQGPASRCGVLLMIHERQQRWRWRLGESVGLVCLKRRFMYGAALTHLFPSSSTRGPRQTRGPGAHVPFTHQPRPNTTGGPASPHRLPRWHPQVCVCVCGQMRVCVSACLCVHVVILIFCLIYTGCYRNDVVARGNDIKETNMKLNPIES